MSSKKIVNSVPFRFRPSVEALEDRRVLSSNVAAQVFDGVLYVLGDSQSNQFQIASYGGTDATITALNSNTTINGTSSVTVSGIRKGYHIVDGGGDNAIVLKGLNAQDTIMLMTGDGNNSVQLLGVSANEGAVIAVGAGNNTITLTDTTINQMFSLVTGNGNNYMALAGNDFGGEVLIHGGSGSNSYGSVGNNFEQGYLVNSFGPGSPPSSTTPVTPPSNVAPTVVLSTTTGNPTLLSPITYTATFSQPVTGFSASGITATNGTVTNFTAVNSTTYTFGVIPTADGVVSVSVATGAAQNSSGIGNTSASTSIQSLRTAQGISSTMPAANSSSFQALGTDGLKIWDVSVGSGAAVNANTTSVSVFYTGWLVSNGTVFDSSLTSGSPAVFSPSGLIQGFKEGLQGMQLGGIRFMYLPAAIAYGSTGSGTSIPPNSDLIFEVKLIATN